MRELILTRSEGNPFFVRGGHPHAHRPRRDRALAAIAGWPTSGRRRSRSRHAARPAAGPHRPAAGLGQAQPARCVRDRPAVPGARPGTSPGVDDRYWHRSRHDRSSARHARSRAASSASPRSSPSSSTCSATPCSRTRRTCRCSSRSVARCTSRSATTLEELYPERLGELAAVLAMHFEQAGDTEKALTYLRRSGQVRGRRATRSPRATTCTPELPSCCRRRRTADDDTSAPAADRDPARAGHGPASRSCPRRTRWRSSSRSFPTPQRLGDLRLEADLLLTSAMLRQFAARNARQQPCAAPPARSGHRDRPRAGRSDHRGAARIDHRPRPRLHRRPSLRRRIAREDRATARPRSTTSWVRRSRWSRSRSATRAWASSTRASLRPTAPRRSPSRATSSRASTR